MLNSKETLKKLHKKFPLLSLDELFDVLDCYVEDSLFSYKPEPWYVSTGSTTTATTKPENCLIAKINYNDDTIARINTAGDRQFTTSH